MVFSQGTSGDECRVLGAEPKNGISGGGIGGGGVPSAGVVSGFSAAAAPPSAPIQHTAATPDQHLVDGVKDRAGKGSFG